MSSSISLVFASSPQHANNSEDLQAILDRHLQQKRQEPSSELTAALATLFDRLKSRDERTVQGAAGEIESGANFFKKYLSLRDLISYSLWSIKADPPALKQIVLDNQSEPTHPLLQDRARVASDYLLECNPREASQVITTVAFKKMQSSNNAVKGHGFTDFLLLLSKLEKMPSQGALLNELLLKLEFPISIAKDVPYYFFTMLIDLGEKLSLTPLGDTVVALCCSSDSIARSRGFEICHYMLSKTNRSSKLDVPLRAAHLACYCNDPKTRSLGFDLFGSLLRAHPESAMDPLLQALKKESEREDASVEAMRRLRDLACPDSCHVGSFIQRKAEQGAAGLSAILINFSTYPSSNYIKAAANKLINQRSHL